MVAHLKLKAEDGLNSARDVLSGYLARYHLALYLSLAAIVAAGVAFNWHWLTTAELIRLITALPCMLMMFKCLNCATSRSIDRTASTDNTSFVGSAISPGHQ